jgi:methoxymalonate biosynthesis protein
MIKCVVWDIDNTLLAGVFLESGQHLPPPDPAMLGILRELSGRGIIHALASKNPPEAAEYVSQVTGMTFAAAECGWGPKSEAIQRVIGELGLAPDAVAFVDDDALERAEVSFALPEVLVLSPEDACDAVGWPEFSPAVVTDEARRRGQMYAQRRRRQEEARAFGGSREEFLRYCGTRVIIDRAVDADVPRLHELSVRTHQFNSAGAEVSQASLADLIGSAEYLVMTVRLADRFGDDGMVGGCVIRTGGSRPGRAAAGLTDAGLTDAGLTDRGLTDRGLTDRGLTDAGGGQAAWSVTLLMMSCRAMGRGVIDALLAWLGQAAERAGAETVRVPCLVTLRNVPLRIALAAAGFRAEGGAIAADRIWRGRFSVDMTEKRPGEPEPAAGDGDGAATARAAVFARPLSGPLPVLPVWATAPDNL